MPTRKKPHATSCGQPADMDPADMDEVNALLDEALRETFPASDPVAISFDTPEREDGEAGDKSGSQREHSQR